MHFLKTLHITAAILAAILFSFIRFLAHENMGLDTIFVQFGHSMAKLWAKIGFSVMAAAHLHMNAFLKPFHQIFRVGLLIWLKGYLIEMHSGEKNSVAICLRLTPKMSQIDWTNWTEITIGSRDFANILPGHRDWTPLSPLSKRMYIRCP